MDNQLQTTNTSQALVTQENMKNYSALLALLHGKTDTICKVFKKLIRVNLNDLKKLRTMVDQKLELHNLIAESTSVDISLSNKKVLGFKSWDEFESYDFTLLDSKTKSIYIQWDFFVKINGYEVPQRHTMGVRISSTPQASDMFKLLLSGEFDDEHSFDIQSSTTICKVDFITHKLAEELINVVHEWNDLCERATENKGKLKETLYKHRALFGYATHYLFMVVILLLCATIIKVVQKHDLITPNFFHFAYFVLILIPVGLISNLIGKKLGEKASNIYANLMDVHIFEITHGDTKAVEKIQKKNEYRSEIWKFIFNVVATIVISIVFVLI